MTLPWLFSYEFSEESDKILVDRILDINDYKTLQIHSSLFP